MIWEIPDVPTGFRKGRGIRDQVADICSLMEKVREFQENIYLCFTDYAEVFVAWFLMFLVGLFLN